MRATGSPFARAVCVAIVFAVGLGASVYPVLRSPEQIRNGIGPFGDSYLYLTMGYNLYAGHGLSGTDDGGGFGEPSGARVVAYAPSVMRGPVYPFFIRIVYEWFGRREAMTSANDWHINWDRVRIAQCVLHAVTCLLVFLIAKNLWPEMFWPAWLAGLLQALGVYSLYYTRALLSESVTTLLVTLSILLTVLALRARRLPWWIAAGAVLGVTALTRPEFAPVPLVLAAYAVFASRERVRLTLRNAGALIAAAIVVVAPWTIRNYRVSGRMILVADSGLGRTLYFGTFEAPQTWREWQDMPDSLFFLPREKERLATLLPQYYRAVQQGGPTMLAVDAEFTRMALNRIRAQPLACARYWIMKIPRLWFQYYVPMYLESEASGAWFVAYFMFALLGFAFAAREQRVLMGVVGVLFAYVNLIFLPLYLEPRYGVALMPGILALAGIGLAKLVLTARNHWQAHTARLAPRP